MLITSRVHPGESNASYLVHGVIKYLLSDTIEAHILWERFIFKIIPMLNPDGVVYGHYRSSLLGVDLNRRWKNPSKYLHPTIYYAKSLAKWLNNQFSHKGNGIILACDFHGHSWKKDVFMYGCCANQNDPNYININSIIRLVPETVC